MSDGEPGVYIGGKKVKAICGEKARWGIGTYGTGNMTMYGYPGPAIKASEFKPDWECCMPVELDRWHAALLIEMETL